MAAAAAETAAAAAAAAAASGGWQPRSRAGRSMRRRKAQPAGHPAANKQCQGLSCRGRDGRRPGQDRPAIQKPAGRPVLQTKAGRVPCKAPADRQENAAKSNTMPAAGASAVLCRRTRRESRFPGAAAARHSSAGGCGWRHARERGGSGGRGSGRNIHISWRARERGRSSAPRPH